MVDLPHPEEIVEPKQSTWNWEAPDLSEGGAFYQARMKRLKEVTQECGGPASWIEEGRKILSWHRSNYGPEGPQRLTILWWEWPKIHWKALTEGSSMNFMLEPTTGKKENSKMDREQLETAIKFVDELIDLGVLVDAEEEDVSNNFPLFLVPKSGQEGQWRCIADGKAGGQNEVCLSDPLHLLQPRDILPRLYPGGYSAIVDASKYFHMFRTLQNEWKYMGVLHPKTGKWYAYATLPMGTWASPAVSCCFGSGFLRTVMDGHPHFQGAPLQNDVTSQLQGKALDARLGTGRVELGNDGTGILLLFMHIDDIFLHGPNLRKVSEGLSHLMDTAVLLGLICQPAKTQPPQQWQKYCGFIYDPRRSPRMYIPTTKFTRGRSLAEYILLHPTQRVSRLALVTIAGTLQSLVPATPGGVGSNYLLQTYKAIHGGMDPERVGTRGAFYSQAEISSEVLEELGWWKRFLGPGMYYQEQVRDTTVTGIMLGDGSGTGAGGTLSFQHLGKQVDQVEAWMGTWKSERGKSQSSNWRELRTLVEFLQREWARTDQRFYNRRVFYFTDNTVTYDVCRRGRSGSAELHKLVTELKMLEAKLNCQVVAVHIPGTEIIAQGSDGLSRGLWSYKGRSHPEWSLSELLQPVALEEDPLTWLMDQARACNSHPEDLADLPITPHTWIHRTDHSCWRSSSLVESHSIWMVSPSLARQAMTAAALSWSESPLKSAAFFIIPRIFQRDFGRVNKHIEFLGQYNPNDTPFDHTLPILVFFLPQYKRRVADLDRRMEPPPNLREPEWVSRQLKHLCGL